VPESSDYQTQLATASGDLERLVARLSRLSPLAWRSRREAIDGLLETLVAICESQQGRSFLAPVLDAHVLADAVAVIGRDIVDTLGLAPDFEQIAELHRAIAAALAATR
jgi:hypothetical protein